MNFLKQLIILFAFFTGLISINGQDGEYRYDYFDITSYSFQIELNDTSDLIRGEAEIKLVLKQKTDTLYLDLANENPLGKGMSVDGIWDENGEVNYTHFSDQIHIPVSGISQNEPKKYTIKYHGIPADGLIISKNKFGDRTFFGDNWPNRAHQWLPCIDHPADKANLEFTVIAPSHYQVVSNGTCTEEFVVNNLLTSRWKTSRPLPTKLMVIGVAEFAKQELATVAGVPVTSWVYPQNKAEGFNDYAVAVKPLVYFSSLIAPFPYSKLASVQSTTFYGGMENAGCIFYAENSVTGTGRAERLVAHEIAHQWFGDAVTEKDWYHIWLSEGFATYLTGLYIEHQYGRVAFLKHINSEKAEVLEYEKYNSSPIIDTSLNVSIELLNPNTYQKASWVLHMLRKELGDSLFIKCIRIFYMENEHKNVVTSDFQKVAERLSGKSLSTFFEQWLYKSGHPVLDISWTHKEKSLTITVKQTQPNTIFSFPLEFKIINKNSFSTQLRVDVSSMEQSFTFNYLNNPLELIPDPGNWILMESVVRQKHIEK